MNSTRLASLAVFISTTVGLTLVAASGSTLLVVAGAALVAAAALALARHLWRESDRKRKQEFAKYEAMLAALVGPLDAQVRSQMGGLQADLEAVSRRVDIFAQGVLEYVAQLELDVKKLGQRQDKVFTSADRLANKRRDSVVSQLSAVLGLYHLFKPLAPYPPFGGWAIGGECAQLLVDLVLEKRPRWVLEAGSGLSTVLTAQALEMLGSPGHIISLEHDETWLDRSRAMLSDHGIGHRAEIIHAPLVPTKVGEEVFQWYDLSAVDLPDEIQFIFVDGPPQATGLLARYPVLPLLYSRLSEGGVLLMDDAARSDERQIVERWKQEFSNLEFRFHSDSKGSVEVIKRG